MSLPASDDFATGYSAFAALKASWTTTSTWRIDATATKAEPQTAADGLAWWNADAFGNDQYSEMVISTVAAYIGPGVRLSGTNSGTQNGYAWLASLGTLYKVVNGVYTSIGSSITVPSNGNTVKLEVIGTTITCYISGSSVKTVTDATHSTGAAGMYGFASAGPKVESWTGDTIGGGGGGRASKNTTAFPLGMGLGMNIGMGGS